MPIFVIWVFLIDSAILTIVPFYSNTTDRQQKSKLKMGNRQKALCLAVSFTGSYKSRGLISLPESDRRLGTVAHPSKKSACAWLCVV